MSRAGRYYLVIFVLSSTLYFLAGLFNSLPFQQSRIVDISTSLDGIYYNVHAVWFYILYYLILIYPVWGCKTYEEAVELGRTVISFSLFSCLIFVLMPVEVYRPSAALLGESLSGLAVRIIYGLDQPYNCFPSLHALHSWVIAIFFARRRSQYDPTSLLLIFAAAAVTVSTITIRQHYVMDVLGGLFLATAWSWWTKDSSTRQPSMSYQ